MNELFATGRTRSVIVDDETWEQARHEAEALSIDFGRRVTISELVRDGLRVRAEHDRLLRKLGHGCIDARCGTCD